MWKAYIQKRGSLSFAAHMEMGFAALMALVVNRTGGKNVSMAKYLHYYKPAGASGDEDEGEATLEDVMSILSGAK